MSEPLSTPAPAATESDVDTYSASQAAVIVGDMGLYRETRRAERAGKPYEDVEVATDREGVSTILEDEPAAPAAEATPKEAAAALPENRKTRAQREQDRINTAIRTAVEAETKSLRDQLARFTAPLAPAGDPRTAEAPKAPTPLEEIQRYQAMPNAPQPEDFGTDADYRAALHLFITDTRSEERTIGARQQELHREFAAAQDRRIDTFLHRFTEAKKIPGWFESISPEVRAIRPASGMDAAKERVGALNVLWDHVYDSPHLAKLSSYFSQHPAELRRFETIPDDIKALPRPMWVDKHKERIAQEFAILERSLGGSSAPSAAARAPAAVVHSEVKHVSSAPEPVETLGRRPGSLADPIKEAVRTGDMGAYRKARLAERIAETQGSRR